MNTRRLNQFCFQLESKVQVAGNSSIPVAGHILMVGHIPVVGNSLIPMVGHILMVMAR
jgi:hypothetical protein